MMDRKQSGNIFLAIFGAVAMVGMIGAGVMTFSKGPVQGALNVIRKNNAAVDMSMAGQTAIMMSTNAAVNASEQAYARVFVTSANYPPTFGGATAADATCQSVATSAGLPGTYKAWISDGSSNPATRFSQLTSPYKLTNGSLIANNWADLIDGTLSNPISVNQSGTSVSAGSVWTGTAVDGTGTGGCTNWSTTAGVGLRGNSGQVGNLWTNGGSISCSNNLPFYCFQQQATVPTSLSGDCDGDSYIEPPEMRLVSGASLAPINGGLVPNSIGIAKRDPWGKEYGYCVWDHGPTIFNASCQSVPGTNKRLRGTNAKKYPVVALISAGADGTFTTTCRNFSAADVNNDGDLEDAVDLPLVSKASASDDDVIVSYNYEDALATSGGMWKLKSGDPTTAILNRNIEIANATIAGSGLFERMAAATGDFIDVVSGLKLADPTVATLCNNANKNVMRRMASGYGIEMCNGSAWTSLSAAAGGGGPQTAILTAGTTSWTVPTGVTSVNVHVIGAGGSGNTTGAGGAGGAYAYKGSFAVTPGAVITTQIGAGGSGTDSWFSSAATVMAKAGGNASSGTGGVAQDAGNSVGDTKYAGGNGANDGAGSGTAGGGGSAGPTGAGKAGGSDGGGSGAGGGGGSNGGASTAGATAANNSTGANGGAGSSGSGGGAGATNTPTLAGDGINGGGGGGGRTTSNGGAGGCENIWSDNSGGVNNSLNAGPCGGGGGGGTGMVGGSVAYGGGSGGGSTAGTAGAGVIVLEYTASAGGGGGGGGGAVTTIDGFADGVGTTTNLFAGLVSGSSNSTGNYNTGLGTNALMNLTTGNGNSAMGYEALKNVTTSSYNTAMGWRAATSLMTGAGYNTAIGYEALMSCTNCAYNTVAGYQAAKMYNAPNGYNTVLGSKAMMSNVTGQYNNVMGFEAGRSFTSGSNNQIIGYQAAQNAAELDGNIVIGYQALQNKFGTLTENIAIGYQALQGTGDSGAMAYNVGVGYQALKNITTGNSNVAIGSQAGINTSTGSDCVMLGFSAMATCVTGNVAVGQSALLNDTSGVRNTALGFEAGKALVSGSDNTLIGARTMQAYQGDFNTAFGAEAIGGTTIGKTTSRTVAMGYQSALQGGNDMVAVGYQSLLNSDNGGYTAPLSTNDFYVVLKNTGTTSSWTPPAGITTVDVHVIGCGGNGLASTTYNYGGGGGGYAYSPNVPVTPGSPVSYYISAGGSDPETTAGTTYFSSDTTVTASCGYTPKTSGDQGYEGSGQYGMMTRSGGKGGTKMGGAAGSGGGGGAAGPDGFGGYGGDAYQGSYAGGGGGANGPVCDSTCTTQMTSSSSGPGQGSPNRLGTGRGAASTSSVPATAGTNGGGGGGAWSTGTTTRVGAAGSCDNKWTDNSGGPNNGLSVGPCGGGGGGGTATSSVGGAGGTYGGGGGGARTTAGAGGQGLIVLHYTTIRTAIVPFNATTWTPPSGVTSVNVHIVGAGGLGRTATSGGKSGGGGGAYAYKANIPVTPGVAIPVVTAPGGTGADTYFKNVSTVMAKAGTNATSTLPGNGGSAASSVGDTKYSGGNGGTGSSASAGAAGGGGSAGPSGAGRNGASPGAATYGGGGGGANGALSTDGSGGDGGQGYLGTGGGLQGVPATALSGGGGGGGSASEAAANVGAWGQRSACQYLWEDTTGAGSTAAVCGGSGGANSAAQYCREAYEQTFASGVVLAGGGTGGCRTYAAGAGNGVIIIQYTVGGSGSSGPAYISGPNTAVGYQSLSNLTYGANNTVVGYIAGQGLTLGNDNTIMGRDAASDAATATTINNVLFGFQTGMYASSSNNVAIGTQAMSQSGATSDGSNVALGYQSLYKAGGSYNVCAGHASCYNASTAIGDGNVAIGRTALSSGTASYNVAIGLASSNKITGASNVAIGASSLSNATDPGGVVAFGASALTANTAPTLTTAFGYNSISGTTSATGITAFGYQAALKAGTNNTAFGYNALQNLINTQQGNVAFGYSAMSATTNTGMGNVSLRHAGAVAMTNNTIVHNAATMSTGLSNATTIGTGAGVTASNTMRFGNSSMTSITAQVAYTFPSDRRLKKDIKPSDLGLDFIMKLKPVSYRLIDGNGRLDYGFLAQDIEWALDGRKTNMITRLNDKIQTYQLRSDDLIAPMVKAVQEQQLELKELEKELESIR